MKTATKVEIPRFVLVRGVTRVDDARVACVWWEGGPDVRPSEENPPRSTVVTHPTLLGEDAMPAVGDVLEHWPDANPDGRPGPLPMGTIWKAEHYPDKVALAADVTAPPRLQAQGPMLLSLEPGDVVLVQRSAAAVHPQLPFPHALETLRLFVMAKQTEKRDDWRKQPAAFHADRMMAHTAKVVAAASLPPSDEDDLLNATLRGLMALEMRAIERKRG